MSEDFGTGLWDLKAPITISISRINSYFGSSSSWSTVDVAPLLIGLTLLLVLKSTNWLKLSRVLRMPTCRQRSIRPAKTVGRGRISAVFHQRRLIPRMSLHSGKMQLHTIYSIFSVSNFGCGNKLALVFFIFFVRFLTYFDFFVS